MWNVTSIVKIMIVIIFVHTYDIMKSYVINVGIHKGDNFLQQNIFQNICHCHKAINETFPCGLFCYTQYCSYSNESSCIEIYI